MDSQFPNFALIESFINLCTSLMSWKIQNKGFETIFKMTWKYKNFREKNYEIVLWRPFGHDFSGIYIFFQKP
jgi:hypothetical protein